MSQHRLCMPSLKALLFLVVNPHKGDQSRDEHFEYRIPLRIISTATTKGIDKSPTIRVPSTIRILAQGGFVPNQLDFATSIIMKTGPKAIMKSGVMMITISRQIKRQRMSLVIVQSFRRIQPGIMAGQPSGLKNAKWMLVKSLPQIQHHSCAQYWQVMWLHPWLFSTRKRHFGHCPISRDCYQTSSWRSRFSWQLN